MDDKKPDEEKWGLCPKCRRWQVLSGVCKRCGCEVDKFVRVIVHTYPNRKERRRREKKYHSKYVGPKNKTI